MERRSLVESKISAEVGKRDFGTSISRKVEIDEVNFKWRNVKAKLQPPRILIFNPPSTSPVTIKINERIKVNTFSFIGSNVRSLIV